MNASCQTAAGVAKREPVFGFTLKPSRHIFSERPPVKWDQTVERYALTGVLWPPVAPQRSYHFGYASSRENLVGNTEKQKPKTNKHKTGWTPEDIRQCSTQPDTRSKGVFATEFLSFQRALENVAVGWSSTACHYQQRHNTNKCRTYSTTASEDPPEWEKQKKKRKRERRIRRKGNKDEPCRVNWWLMCLSSWNE